MIKGIGVDIVELDRIPIEKEHFAKKVLSKKEYQIYISKQSDKRKREYLGSRFASKEAYLKARGKGLGEIPLSQIEILTEDSGKPYFTNDKNAHISLSHEKHYAIAYVVIEEGI